MEYSIQDEDFVEAFFNFDGIENYDDTQDDNRKEILEYHTEE